jgi:aminoglycoside phosphotransferase (APT) family kinase protein
MAAVGPRELDLAWLVFMHEFFQQIAIGAGLPGMPDFLAPDVVQSVYAEASGIEPREFAWYETYAALRHAIIMSRIHARSVHFGEAEWPEDLDEVIPHRATLERMLGGSRR